MSKIRPGLVFCATIVSAATLLTACGSSTSSSKKPAGNSPPASSTGTADAVAKAKAHVEALKKPISIGYSPGPLGGSVAGKTIALVSNQLPTAHHVAELQTVIASELGLKTKTFFLGNSAEQIANGFDQILEDPSISAVFAGGIAPSAGWLPQFNTLVSRHIPVILTAVSDDPAWSTKATAIAESPSTGTDAVSGDMADWITADSNGDADTAIFSISSYPILKAVTDSFQAAYTKSCPGCRLGVSDVAISGIGTTIPGAIVSFLQAHPKVTYVVADFADELIGVPAALKAAGMTNIKLISQSAGATSYQAIKDGTETVEFSYPFPLILRVMFDAAARAMLGKDVSAAKAWKMPVQLLDASTITTGAFNTDGTVNVPNVDSYFQGLWNS